MTKSALLFMSHILKIFTNWKIMRGGRGEGGTQGKWPTGRAAPKGMFLRLVKCIVRVTLLKHFASLSITMKSANLFRKHERNIIINDIYERVQIMATMAYQKTPRINSKNYQILQSRSHLPCEMYGRKKILIWHYNYLFVLSIEY